MAMTLRQARCTFTLWLARLILHMYDCKYEVAIDEATEHLTAKDPTSDHMPGSLHHIGLAADLNLYKDGVWCSKTEDFTQFGEWWEEMGKKYAVPLAWGGRFKNADGNHFSFEWEGRR